MSIARKNRVCFVAAVIATILVPAIASAQGFRNPPQDARAAGMGNAFAARADNASAVYYNPAGIAFQESPLSVTGNLSIIDPRFKNTTQGFRTEKKDFFVPDGFIATNLFNKYLSFGYGAFSEFGLGYTYPKDSPAAPLAYLSSLQTMDNRFTWALRPPKPLDWTAIAGGFDLLYGQTRTKSTIDLGAFAGSPTGPISRARFTGEGHAFGWHLAALAKAKKMHSAGITFASQMDVNEHGHFRLAGIPSSIAPVPELSYPATSKFVLPARITAGYNFKPVDWFQVECDLTWLKYNKFKNVAIDIEDPTGFMPSQVINFDFTNSWVWALGAELGPFKGFSLRSGWCYIQTPVPGSTFNSMIPDSDRNVATVGLGYKYKKISFDVCYAAVVVNKRKVNNSVGYPFTSINGTWKGFINQIMMGASYAL